MFYLAITKRPKEATVPGLGTLRFKGAMPCTVHEARILIYSDNECRAMIHRTGNNGTQLQNAFCAGYLQGGIDTCQVRLYSKNQKSNRTYLANVLCLFTYLNFLIKCSVYLQETK